MRLDRLPPSTDRYPRPHHAWNCGLADDGPPCPSGPDSCGRCPLAAACHPVREGDRWRCNRSELRGGPCATGPGPDGACCVVYQCTPVRTLRTKRGAFIASLAVAAAGALVMLFGSDARQRFIAPGPLAAVHAHLVTGADAAASCAQCHAAGAAPVAAWARYATGRTSLGAAQPELCMNCHDARFAAELALAAHTTPLETLRRQSNENDAAVATVAPRRDPAEPLACAACHREHQGADHALAAVGPETCHACHQRRFHSFGDGHPEFGAWPYAEPTPLAFDHAVHQAKHFPEEKKSFACAACHAASSDGAQQLTHNYATACAGCHDKALVASLLDGVMVASLPMLDVEALADAGHAVADWPAEATGDFDGAVPWPTRLLLAADARATAALDALGSDFDFYDLDVDDPAQLAAAADVARGLQTLAAELADKGGAAIAARLHALLGRALTAEEARALAAGLRPADVSFATAAATPSDRWRMDGAGMTLRYQQQGHDDPWLRAWLDVLAEAASGPRGAVFQPVLAAALKPTAPGQCGRCHALRRDGAALSINWRAATAQDRAAPAGLTRFSHAPHLTPASLRDCAACHRLAPPTAAAASTPEPNPSAPAVQPADFLALNRELCAACHAPHAAGDSCTQCHAYHAGKSVGGGR